MKNKIIRTYSDVEHIVYEVSAEILSTLPHTHLYEVAFKNIANHEERLFLALSHVRSEAERTRTAISLMKDLWKENQLYIPYPVPSLLGEGEFGQKYHKHYRDHTVHQLRVFLLGLYIYSTNKTLARKVRQHLQALRPATDFSDHDFLWVWLLLSLYHDQGYIFEHDSRLDLDDEYVKQALDLLNESFDTPVSRYIAPAFGITLERIREQRARRGLRLPAAFTADSLDDLLYDVDGTATILTDLEPRVVPANLGRNGRALQDYYKLTRNERAKGGRPPFFDHGLASAIMLARSARELSAYLTDLSQAENNGRLDTFIPNQEVRSLIVEIDRDLKANHSILLEAAAAIALHNIYPKVWRPEIYASSQYDLTLGEMRIPLDGCPLAFLLALVDTLQDWDRPRFTLPPEADYIAIDQNLLISCDNSHVYISPLFQSSTEDETYYNQLISTLKEYLENSAVDSLVRRGASITFPEEMSAAEPSLAVAEQLSARHRLDSLDQHWSSYLDAKIGSASKDEDAWRSSRIRHLGALLDWCEREHYEYTKRSDHPGIEKIYEHIRLEINDLNQVPDGTVIRGRVVTGTIGSGGYGTVFRVNLIDDEDSVEALKVFHTSNFKNPVLADRFRRGFESMASLDHPQITKVKDYCLIPRGYFLEYIDGDNLADFVRKRSGRKTLVEPETRLTLFLDICTVIESAHREHVYHRDIKPENILMRWSVAKNRFEPVLTDFDLAWHMQASALTVSRQEVVGSYLYASPEQKRLASDDDDVEAIRQPTVDIYSLGKLLYFIMTDSPPDDTRDLSRLITETLQARYHTSNLKSFPFVMARIFDKATQLQPRFRYPTVSAMMSDIQQGLALLDSRSGQLEQRHFLREIALRTGLLYSDELEGSLRKGSFAHDFGAGQMFVSINRPKHPTWDLEVRVQIQEEANLAAIESRSFRDARAKLNTRYGRALDECGLKIYHRAKGGAGILFSLSFRIGDLEHTVDEALKISDLLNSLKIY